MENLITAKEAAKILGKNHTMLADWRHQGRGPKYIRIGRSIRYRPSDLIEFIEKSAVTPGGG